MRKERTKKIAASLTLMALSLASQSCSSLKSLFALKNQTPPAKPIANPFGDLYQTAKQNRENIILRTKKGDRSVEVELPGSNADMTDFVMPVSPAFQEGGRSPAYASAEGVVDESYMERAPSHVDREITNTFTRGNPAEDGKRREIEDAMGVIPAEDEAPESNKSYLAAIDHIKQLYKLARYEAALLEVDQMIRQYQTDPRLYKMRGTILDRLGHLDLAIKSWSQGLRLDPGNQSLRRFIERKQQKRGLSSQ